MNKKSLINKIGLTLVFLSFIFGVVIGYNDTHIQKKENTSIEDVEMVNISISVEGKSKDIEVKKGLSVMDIMKENYDLQTQYDGTFISGIDDVVADETNFIAFYINGEMSTVGAGDYIPNDGDNIEFKLTLME